MSLRMSICAAISLVLAVGAHWVAGQAAQSPTAADRSPPRVAGQPAPKPSEPGEVETPPRVVGPPKGQGSTTTPARVARSTPPPVSAPTAAKPAPYAAIPGPDEAPPIVATPTGEETVAPDDLPPVPVLDEPPPVADPSPVPVAAEPATSPVIAPELPGPDTGEPTAMGDDPFAVPPGFGDAMISETVQAAPGGGDTAEEPPSIGAPGLGEVPPIGMADPVAASPEASRDSIGEPPAVFGDATAGIEMQPSSPEQELPELGASTAMEPMDFGASDTGPAELDEPIPSPAEPSPGASPMPGERLGDLSSPPESEPPSGAAMPTPARSTPEFSSPPADMAFRQSVNPAPGDQVTPGGPLDQGLADRLEPGPRAVGLVVDTTPRRPGTSTCRCP